MWEEVYVDPLGLPTGLDQAYFMLAHVARFRPVSLAW